MTLSHKNCIFFNFLSESLKTDTEDLPDQIETSVQFSQIKAKQIKEHHLRMNCVPGTVLRRGIYGARKDSFLKNLDITGI